MPLPSPAPSNQPTTTELQPVPLPCFVFCSEPSHITPLPPPTKPRQKYDLYHGGPGRRGGPIKPHVVLSSYETVLKERSLFQVGSQGAGGRE